MSKRLFFLFLLSILFAKSFAQEKTGSAKDIRITIGEPNPEKSKQALSFNGQIKGENGTGLEGINLLPALNEGTITNKKENLALDYPMGIINLALKV